MSRIELLRNLPSVDRVLRDDSMAEIPASHSRRQLTAWARSAIEACRGQLLDGPEFGADEALLRIIKDVRRRAAFEDGRTLQKVINATGVLLHTNLGRSPLADRAVERIQAATAYGNVELNLETGKRNQRGERVAGMIAELVAAEDALVVNNCAAAIWLALHVIADGREVVISRGQLVEIGGGFRLPDVFAQAGVRLREVGTTNRTYLRDYEEAVGEQTGAILRVHHGNFHQTGFVAEPAIQELIECRRPEDVPIIDDVGSGCLDDLSFLGLQEPSVKESVAAGADLTLFSGDKLFGGPQCGILAGKKRWIDKMRTCPLMRALRIDKLTLAALEATVEIHLAGAAFEELPVLRMLTNDGKTIEARCRDAQSRLAGIPGFSVSVVPCESQVGGGALPGVTLESFALKIVAHDLNLLAKRLRTGTPAILPRLTDESLCLDFRTVDDRELEDLISRLRAVFTSASGDGKSIHEG